MSIFSKKEVLKEVTVVKGDRDRVKALFTLNSIHIKQGRDLGVFWVFVIPEEQYEFAMELLQ
jgi:hypothetical protein